MHDVRLKVGGGDYGGWKSVRISRGIEQIASGFEVSVSEIWPGRDPARDLVKIKPGDACRLSIHADETDKEGTTVITGFVDEVRITHDATSHEIKIAGRDA